MDLGKKIESHWLPKLYAEHEQYQKNQQKNDNTGKEKFYILPMFPYPSGRLHMGHVRVYTLSDTLARFYRMKNYHVIHPMGWDSFGLPAENAAMQRSEQPDQWTDKNIAYMKDQIKKLGCSFDWNRELSTCDPNYYKWTQYIFVMLYNEGLVYQKKAAVNWDPVDQTVLAEEQIDENGRSWRSGAVVEKKYLKQWFIRTRALTKSLLDGLETLNKDDWEALINTQKMWMGDCNGCNNVRTGYDQLECFTVTPESLLNVTHLYIRSDHKLVQPETIEKLSTGVERLNVYAIHPLNGQMLPIFIDNEVDYGPKDRNSVPVLNVQLGNPNLNEYDRIFATKHGISIKNDENSNNVQRSKIMSDLQKCNAGGYLTSGRLNDWCISRQRYWGTPIPIIECEKCSTVPVPFDQLPVKLPSIEDVKFGKKSGISPLANAEQWMKTTCPKCGNAATRSIETMDTFVDSSWYFLRFLDNKNQLKPFDGKKVNPLMPVDCYIGGIEHAITHLFVARFIQHFFYSKNICTSMEPFKRFIPIGIVQGKTYITKDGRYLSKDDVYLKDDTYIDKTTQELVNVEWKKMSKSKQNGIDPEEIINEYGIDFTRFLMMNFVHPRSPRNFNLEDGAPTGVRNWFRFFWSFFTQLRIHKQSIESTPSIDNKELEKIELAIREQRLNTIYSVNFFITSFFNIPSAIIEIQKLTKYLVKLPLNIKLQSKEHRRALCDCLIMLAPIIPFLTSEIWTFVQKEFSDVEGYDLSKSLFEQNYPNLPDDYPTKVIAMFDWKPFAFAHIAKNMISTLSMDDAYKLLLDQPSSNNILTFIKENNLRVDRIRLMAGVHATLIFEQSKTVNDTNKNEQQETSSLESNEIIEKKKKKFKRYTSNKTVDETQHKPDGKETKSKRTKLKKTSTENVVEISR
ncbi:unnamed protein product [Didymodactylos carnosus]|uniref:leucine--tRNA ligase n=1 Tax=Didymodactylos carnosus TaxID=1234261 RepID=A0A8S2DLA9_9BILA|nr:unnamed protein product [Didymodactylos carnosus]CAF3715322.1 unnamed protein product [Didymodactylos carnosus]